MIFIVDRGHMKGAEVAVDDVAGLVVVNHLHRRGQTDARLYRADRGVWAYEWLGTWFAYDCRNIPIKLLDLAGEDEREPS